MISQEDLLYGALSAHVRRMLEPVAHDSFLFFDETLSMIEKEIPSGAKVLDAGCGRGTLTLSLAERGCQVMAIDSSADRIDQTRELLREKKQGANVALDVFRLPDAFPENNFDAILDCFSWWHISDWGKLLTVCKKHLRPQGRIIILDTFFGWKTTLEFRADMRERWLVALPTLNECRNMLIKRDFRLLKSEAVQEPYIRYMEAMNAKIHELEKEDLGSYEPTELQAVKSMWEWFRQAARKEELAATFIVAELTEN